MELYRADSSFQGVEVIEDYDSLIWTERYAAYGDFSLTMKYNYMLARNLRQRTYLRMSESNRIMCVETAEIQNQDGERTDTVKLTGRSIESFLGFRNSKKFGSADSEAVTGTRGGIANYIVNRYCVDSTTAGAVNVIPNLTILTAPAGSTITLIVPKGDIYGLVKAICDGGQLGFQISNSRGSAELKFQVYTGIDRTDPAANYYMEYSSDNDNLRNLSSVESIANYKNHARVLGAKTGVDVYLPGTSSSVSGFDRRTIMVDAGDIGTGSTTIAEDELALTLRGYEALYDQSNKFAKLIDGDIPQDAWNKVYYGLGDIVMVEDSYGSKVKSMITEQIWSSDASGLKRTPTFEPI